MTDAFLSSREPRGLQKRARSVRPQPHASFDAEISPLRVRAALAEYKRNRRTSMGKRLGWGDVAGSIELASGVEIRPEALRRFVDGHGGRSGGSRRFETLLPDRLAAVVTFLTSVEGGQLTVAELSGRSGATVAAAGMRDFLLHDAGSSSAPVPAGVAGRYRTTVIDGMMAKVIDLDLGEPSPNGTIEAARTLRTYPKALARELDGMTSTERRKIQSAAISHAGWAVITSDNNLLVFLRKARSGEHLHYVSLASDLRRDRQPAIQNFILLEREKPDDLDDYLREETSLATGRKMVTLGGADRLARHIRHFHRLSSFDYRDDEMGPRL